MTQPELAVGHLITWAVGKADPDRATEPNLDRLHALVSQALGADPALADLEAEGQGGRVTDLTRQRVELSVRAAAGRDGAFRTSLGELIELMESARTTGGAVAGGSRAAVVQGSVSVHAEDHSAAAVTMGDVALGGPPNPRQPDRSRD